MPTLQYTNLDLSTTTVATPHGVEWGYSSPISLALAWEKMTNGLWRSWDRGAIHDSYGCDVTWKGPASTLSDLRALIHDSARGRRMRLVAEAGFYPFGLLVPVTDWVSVRVASLQPMQRIGGSADWSLSMTLVLDQDAAPNLSGRDMSALWQRGMYAPSIDPGWALSSERIRRDPLSASYDSTVSLRTTRDQATKILAGLVFLRGGDVSVPASRDPFGPGVPVSSGGGSSQFCKVRGFSCMQESLDVWSISASISRIP